MNVLVLCGGRSSERDVSCVSAAAILRHLSSRHRPFLVHVDALGRWRLQARPFEFARSKRPERYPFERTPAFLELSGGMLRAPGRRAKVGVVFPIIHGPYGEDGTLQGLLELAGVPYVGSGVLGSAVCMDKALTKRLALQAGLPVLPYVEARRPSDVRLAGALRPPFFVKPCRLGSSVGVYKVKSRQGLAAAVRRALRFDTSVLIEQGARVRELECALLGDERGARASCLGEIRPKAEFYSYEAKYLDPEGARLLVPAPVPEGLSRRVRAMALEAFRVLGCHGLARADFFLDQDTGKVWFNEINTLPGFTAISMYPRLWEASGLPFTRLIDRLLALALARRRQKARLSLTVPGSRAA